MGVPSPWRSAVCVECDREWQTQSKTARTCSPKCRAQLREKEHGPTKGAAPREYPPELVDQVREMYAKGHTIAEIQAGLRGVKVYNIVKRYGIETRPRIPRNQRGQNNASWLGDAAGYKAMHLRVYNERGAPHHCTKCDTRSASRYEWANLTGNYQDVNDYQRMCVACHRRFDAARRRATGMRTSPSRR